MYEEFTFFPEAASSFASRVDAIYLALVGISIFFTVLIAFAVLAFSVRYRRRKGVVAEQVEGSLALEALWSGIPLVIVLVLFGWGAKVFLEVVTPPKEGMEFYVTGKQWMWKIQHPTGHREINTLHVPVGRADRPDDDLRGRDPRLLHPGLPHQVRHGPGHVLEDVVRSRPRSVATTCSVPSTAVRSTPR